MSRSGSLMHNSNLTPLRKVKPDPVYRSFLVAKLINYLMHDGKIEVSRKIVYGAIEMSRGYITETYNAYHEDPAPNDAAMVCWFFERILSELAPSVEVRSLRLGGSNYQIPWPVSSTRALILSLLWLKKAVRSRKERTAKLRLAAELNGILTGRSEAMKEKDRVKKIADANRAFAHYAARMNSSV